MKKIIILYCFFSLCQYSYTQEKVLKEIDSLQLVLKNAKQDTLKVNTYSRLASQYYYIDSQKSLHYAKKALSLATKINFEFGIAHAYNNIGIYYYLKSNFPLALNYIYKSHHIFEKLNDFEGLAITNNGLGMINIEFKNFKQALQNYNEAIKASQKLGDKKSTSVYLNNIGDVHLRMKNYKQALYYFQKAIISNDIEKTQYESGINYTNIAITLNFLKQYKKSILYSNQSIAIYNNDSSLYNGYNLLELGKSYYYLSQEEKNQTKKNQLLEKSLNYINESMKIFKREASLIDIRDGYSYLSKIYRTKGKQQLALTYFEKSTALNDSIFSTENKSQIELLKSKRELELRDKKIEIQNLEINNDTRKVYLLYTITIAIFVLFGFSLWLYISKRKANLQLNDKNKIIIDINQQKNKFFSIIAHDLRGPFNGFLGLTELLADDIDSMDKKEIQFAATNMRSSARNLNNLLENLLEWSRMEQGLLPCNPQQNQLLPLVLECINTLKDGIKAKNITINNQIDEKIIVFADTNIIKTIIRNIISNAVKFTPTGGTIIIQGKEDETNTTIAIKDSGIGMNKKIKENLFRLDLKTNRKGTNDEPSSGLGLILCKEFVDKHNGQIWVESEENKGSTFYFSFPKAIT